MGRDAHTLTPETVTGRYVGHTETIADVEADIAEYLRPDWQCWYDAERWEVDGREYYRVSTEHLNATFYTDNGDMNAHVRLNDREQVEPDPYTDPEQTDVYDMFDDCDELLIQYLTNNFHTKTGEPGHG